MLRLRDYQHVAAAALMSAGQSMTMSAQRGMGKSWAPRDVYAIEIKRKPTFRNLRQQRRKLKKISQRRNRK